MELFHKVGFLAVAMFFFLSGYGVETQRRRRPGYLSSTFLPRRACELFIPAVLANSLWALAEWRTGVNGLDLSKGRALLYIFDMTGHYTISTVNRYISFLFLLLVIYWISYRLFSGRKAFAVLVAAIMALTLYRSWTWVTAGSNRQDFGMLFCFAMGVAWAGLNEEGSTVKRIRRHYWPVVLVTMSAAVFFIALYILSYQTIPGELVWRNLGTSVFVVFAALALLRVDLRNTVSVYMGKISMEVYLLHMLVITLLVTAGPAPRIPLLRGCVVLVATLCAAGAFHCLLRPVSDLLHFLFAGRSRRSES